jgi:hypothetical protein
MALSAALGIGVGALASMAEAAPFAYVTNEHAMSAYGT